MNGEIPLPAGKHVYFLSDFHLGAPDAESSLVREKLIVRFFEEKRKDAAAFFIMGDMFDFWYEYKRVVPRGYTRLFGKLAELTDSGIDVRFFVGNHDMWMRDYLQKELNIPVYFEPADFFCHHKSFHIGHGDGQGPGDHGYKTMKKVFRNPVCQWLFGLFPPYLGIGLADYFSRKSRAATGTSEEVFKGEEKEWLILYAREVLQRKKVDFFIFGHRHLPIDYPLNAQSRYINLGDWIQFFTYATFDGEHVVLRSYTGQDHKIVRT